MTWEKTFCRKLSLLDLLLLVLPPSEIFICRPFSLSAVTVLDIWSFAVWSSLLWWACCDSQTWDYISKKLSTPVDLIIYCLVTSSLVSVVWFSKLGWYFKEAVDPCTFDHLLLWWAFCDSQTWDHLSKKLWTPVQMYIWSFSFGYLFFGELFVMLKLGIGFQRSCWPLKQAVRC